MGLDDLQGTSLLFKFPDSVENVEEGPGLMKGRGLSGDTAKVEEDVTVGALDKWLAGGWCLSGRDWKIIGFK